MFFRLLRSLISTHPYTIWRHYSKQYLKRVHELAFSGEFDIVHCDILPLAYIAWNRLPVFSTLTDHDVSYLKCLRIAETTPNLLLKLFLYLEAYKLKKLESSIFDYFNLGLAVSNFDKGILENLCPAGKFAVIENGVNASEMGPSLGNGEANSLLWLGGFDHYPNKEGTYFFLEEIYPLIKQQIPDVNLMLVGGGVTLKLRQFASADPSLKILGRVDDIWPHMRRAAVFIVPLKSGSGTRLKILEAMAAGKAIVTTGIGCEGIEGTHGVHYMVADTPAEFADITIRLITDEGERARLGENASRLARYKYDWKIINGKLDKLYRETVLASAKLDSLNLE